MRYLFSAVNLQGAHGGGAARVARKLFGAIQGQGVGGHGPQMRGNGPQFPTPKEVED